MIFDTLKNKALYYGCHKDFEKSFNFIEKAIRENLPLGKYEIDGENVFANIQSYEPTPDNDVYEGHRNYIDIQFIVSGNEFMECAEIDTCTSTKPYAPDCELFKANGNTAKLECGANTFAIFFPNDIHKPSKILNPNEVVKKIVVKVAVE
ncbi:MAG: YhcH/YjgK/YiaL family protein [Clostridia bacterium]|nr:YhcH/YjgK/YiaL family protein [Clostridia bacterium]